MKKSLLSKPPHIKFSSTEDYLINFMSNNISKISSLSITELSELANVSTATIVRTLQKLNYDGYTDFKHEIKYNFRGTTNYDIVKDVNTEIKNAVLKNEQEIINTIKMMDIEQIKLAISKLNYAKKVIIFARGFSELIAQEVLVKLQLLDKYVELHTDPNIIRSLSEKFTSSCLVIFISLNGNTSELVDAGACCKHNNIPTILFTANDTGKLYKLCDIKFNGFKSSYSYFPNYEVRSRLPLNVMVRILLDSYAIHLN